MIGAMRAAFEHIEPTAQLSWKLHVRREQRFDFLWHFHREYELTLITKGSGTRLVGDGVQDYVPGDLTLIGPEVPHTYVSQSSSRWPRCWSGRRADCPSRAMGGC